jgi:methylase of polypeptide subunit release factors
LCCGAGHIGLLAISDTGRPGFLVDADPVACDHARANAARARLDGLVTVVEHRMDGGRIPGLDGRSPLVLADPPYVPTEQADRLSTDPRSAVDGGRDGLEVVHAVLRSADHHLAPGGVCLLQVHGARQAEQIQQRLTDTWGDIRMTPGEVRTFGPERAVQLLVATPPGGIGWGSAG